MNIVNLRAYQEAIAEYYSALAKINDPKNKIVNKKEWESDAEMWLERAVYLKMIIYARL